MVHVDTSVLVDALSRPWRSGPRLRGLIAAGERLALSALVLYEWRRGPRTPDELAIQEELLPSQGATPFGPDEAEVAARLYRRVARPARRTADLAIAACAIAAGARLWTLNRADFADLPGLVLVE